jgi:hypothetical protein
MIVLRPGVGLRTLSARRRGRNPGCYAERQPPKSRAGRPECPIAAVSQGLVQRNIARDEAI